MKNVIVTGGLGFVGSNLVDLLIERNYNVIVIDNLSSISSNIDYKNMKAEYFIDDAKNISKLQLPSKIDYIFHLGAHARIQPSFDNPVETLENNVMTTAKVCEYATKHNSKVIYAGSSSFYSGEKNSPYAFSKWNGEQVCAMYNNIYKLPYVVSRFFNVYGNRQPNIGEFATVIGIFEKKYHNNEPLTIIGDGNQKRHFTHIDDICEGLIMLAESNKDGIYNLGYTKNYSINEIVDIFIKNSKKEVTKVYLPKRINEADVVMSDISKTTNDIGWVPKYDIEDYLKNIL
jgi:UDP-glucose 4-epimerase